MHLPEVFSQHNFRCLRFMQLLPTIGSTHSNLTLPSPSFTVPAAGAPTGLRRRAMAAPPATAFHGAPSCLRPLPHAAAAAAPWLPPAAAPGPGHRHGPRATPPPAPLLGRTAAPWPPPGRGHRRPPAAAAPWPPARCRPRPRLRHGHRATPPPAASTPWVPLRAAVGPPPRLD